jgi:chemotaxis protein MotB
VLKGGGEDLTRQGGQVKRGDVEAEKKRINLLALKAEQRRAEMARLEDLRRRVEDVMASNPTLAAVKSQMRLDMTRDGLRIQIVDEQNRAMFDSGSALVKPAMRELLRALGTVLAEVPNRLTLEGHTDAQPFAAGDRGYSNWELSSDRANASRRELVAGGLPDDRVLRVQGLASSNPLERDDPASPANRRISIIVMNRDAEDRLFRPGAEAEPEAAAASTSAAAAR